MSPNAREPKSPRAQKTESPSLGVQVEGQCNGNTWAREIVQLLSRLEQMNWALIIYNLLIILQVESIDDFKRYLDLNCHTMEEIIEMVEQRRKSKNRVSPWTQ
jgi:hypothetical protein